MTQFKKCDRVLSQNPRRDQRDHNTVYIVERIMGSGGDENAPEPFKDINLLTGKFYQPGDYVLAAADGSQKRHGEKGIYMIPA
jgi:hypothetical protein